MKKRTKAAFVAAEVALAATLLTACGSGNQGTAENANGSGSMKAGTPGTFTVALDGNPTTMDPADTQDTLSNSIQGTMYQGLLGFNSQMQIVPVLATDYQVNKTATSITFDLRQGVTFQDGTPFNADAVKANLDRDRDPNNHLKRYSLFSMIKDVKVLNPYKVEVDLSSPFGAIANNFAHPAAKMISPKALQEYGAKVAQHPVGTGPFEFVAWHDGSDLEVKANPHYWGQAPKVNEIDFKFVPQASTRIAMLQTNEAQFIYPVPTDQVSTIQSKQGITVKKSPGIYVIYLAMNTSSKPFNDVRVRQALNYAVDKQGFIQVAQNGYATPAYSAIAPNTWGYSAQPLYQPDVAKAKQLLAEAGYPNGFSATLICSTSSDRVKWAQFIQQQLAQIGVTVTIQPMDSATMNANIFVPQSQSKLQLYLGGWSPSTGDADWGLRPLLTKADFPPVGYNIGFYTDPTVESAIKGALQTADPTVRKQDYAVAQAKIYQDAPWVFLSVPDNIYAYQSGVSGAAVRADGSLDLNDVSMK